MIIRKANVNDINNLVEIRLAYLNEDFKGLSEDERTNLNKQLPDYFDRHLEKDLVVFLAEEDQSIISSVFLLIIEKPANPNLITGRIGNILNVYTRPDYRRQGLAGQLMKMAMDEAKALKLTFLELNATKSGYPLYQKLGFHDFKSEHVVLMKYRIDENH